MSIFRFSKAFSIGRDAKVFLNLEGGLTRGVVPEEAEKLRNVVEEQRKRLRSKDQQIKEQAENLRIARQQVSEQKKTRKGKEREIFQLRNELVVAKERVKGALKGRSASQVTVEPEVGALPDFLIIGAPKGGTTTLYDLLTQHPDVERAALKELNYFDNNFEKGVEWYRSQFPPPRWKDERRSITGEATPRYLFHPLAPERVAEVVPQARLIVLLRNPVDRAYSHYHHRVRTVRELRRFEEAVEAEKEWLPGKEGGEHEEHRAIVSGRQPFPYLKMGIYVDQLRRWSEFFDEEQMLVLKSEDFFERELETLKVVLDFLGLPDWGLEASKIGGKGHYERGMDPSTKRRLEEYFEPHNRRLCEHLEVDFGW